MPIDNNSNSKLISNSENLRNTLYSRNLYNPNSEYPVLNKDKVNRTVDAINSVIDTIAPFKSFDLKNTVFGRLISNKTPLTEVGLKMLGKQFTLNSMSHIAQQTFPVIKISNLFDNNKDTKLFTKKINYSITKKKDSSNFQQFLDDVVYYYPQKNYPFDKNSNNSDFIKNTGTGQLNLLYKAVNQNIYKQGQDNTDTTFYDYAKNADTQIDSRSSLISIGTTHFFDFGNKIFNPYSPFNNILNSNSYSKANQNMVNALNNEDKISSEYAPNKNFIGENFGTTIKSNLSIDWWNSDSQNDWIDNNVEFSNDDVKNKLVWGSDGVSTEANKKITELRGDTEYEKNKISDKLNIDIDFNNSNNFNIKAGLLEYTRNLLIATEGSIVDITRKAFTNGNTLVGFNGSGLWKANDSKYAEQNKISGKRGIRQHTVLDQYDRFAKAIRFSGNKVYGGNENSVTYNSVLPRIHPTMNKDGGINNKNLMFSIENLAISVISRDKVGIIDDEYGSPIPLS